jgi:hypothetical protein
VQVETAWGRLGGSGVYVGVDTDLASFRPPIPRNLPLFVNIGLTDSDFNAKPALAAWDALHARPLLPWGVLVSDQFC